MKLENNKIYLLSHIYEYGENNEFDEVKELGVYSSHQKAEEAIDRYIVLEGFNKYPRSCFCISEQELDVDAFWREGFMTYEEINEFQKKNNICQGEEYKKSVFDE